MLIPKISKAVILKIGTNKEGLFFFFVLMKGRPLQSKRKGSTTLRIPLDRMLEANMKKSAQITTANNNDMNREWELGSLYLLSGVLVVIVNNVIVSNVIAILCARSMADHVNNEYSDSVYIPDENILAGLKQ
jgi:hypothetical protein